jgi:hypothetical protein
VVVLVAVSTTDFLAGTVTIERLSSQLLVVAALGFVAFIIATRTSDTAPQPRRARTGPHHGLPQGGPAWETRLLSRHGRNDSNPAARHHAA